MLIYTSPKDLIISLVYLDDIVITGSNYVLIQSMVDKLIRGFVPKDLGAINFFLGI